MVEEHEAPARAGDQVSTHHVVVVVAALLGMVAFFLPWMEAPLLGAGKGNVYGWWAMGFCFVAGLSLLLVPIAASVSRVLIASCGAAVAGIAVWLIFLTQYVKAMLDRVDELSAAAAHAFSVGPGVYLVLLSGLALIAGSLVPTTSSLAPSPSSSAPSRTRRPLSAGERILWFLSLTVFVIAIVCGTGWMVLNEVGPFAP